MTTTPLDSPLDSPLACTPAAPHASRAAAAAGWAARIGALAHTRALGWTLVALAVALWQASVSAGWIAIPSLPSPSHILLTWWQEATGGTLLAELGLTLKLMLTGYLCAAVAGSLVGLLIGRVRLAWAALEPFVELIRPIPISAVVPLLILFLGIDDALKLTTVFWGSFFPVLLNTFAGVRSLPRAMEETGQTFGLTRWQITWEIVLPHSLPSIFVGLRVAMTLSLIIAVFSEMLAGSSGIGYFIATTQQTMSVDKLYAGVLTLSVTGYLLNLLFLRVERMALPWTPGSARRQAR